MSTRAERVSPSWSGVSTAILVLSVVLSDELWISAAHDAPAVHDQRHDQYAVRPTATIATAATANAIAVRKATTPGRDKRGSTRGWRRGSNRAEARRCSSARTSGSGVAEGSHRYRSSRSFSALMFDFTRSQSFAQEPESAVQIDTHRFLGQSADGGDLAAGAAFDEPQQQRL